MQGPLRVDIYRVQDDKKVGTFFIPADATLEWLQRNTPLLLQVAQTMAEDTFQVERPCPSQKS